MFPNTTSARQCSSARPAGTSSCSSATEPPQDLSPMTSMASTTSWAWVTSASPWTISKQASIGSFPSVPPCAFHRSHTPGSRNGGWRTSQTPKATSSSWSAAAEGYWSQARRGPSGHDRKGEHHDLPHQPHDLEGRSKRGGAEGGRRDASPGRGGHPRG